MRTLSVVLLICSFCLADFIYDPPAVRYRGVECLLRIEQDKTLDAPADCVYLDINNKTQFVLRIEPHYNSYVVINGRKRFGVPLHAPAAFKEGLITANSQVSGYIYFPSKTLSGDNFQIVIPGVKLYDGDSMIADLEWDITNSTTASPDELSAADKPQPKLGYDEQFLVKTSEQIDLTGTKVDLPAKALRGQTIPLNIYLPTGVAADQITAVIGISSYVDMTEGKDGVFTGTFRVPELFDPGKYIVSFYVRTDDKRKGVFQKELVVQ